MLKLNKQGDLIDGTPDDETLLATAAELKAALAEAGKVVISVEDARAAEFLAAQEAWRHGCGDTDKAYQGVTYADLADRLRAAIKENEHD